MPVLNLLWIREPAYVLRGKILTEPPPRLEAGVWIFTASRHSWPGSASG